MDVSNETVVEERQCRACLRRCRSPMRTCVVGHAFCMRCDIASQVCRICGREKKREQGHDFERFRTLVFTRRDSVLRHRPRLDTPRFETSREETPVAETSLVDMCSQENGHDEFCPLNTVPCPLHCVSSCTWIGKFKDVFAHCDKEHPFNTYATKKTTLFVRKNVHGSNCHILFKAYDKLFLFASYINTPKTLIKWTVTFIGPREEAENYDYQIEIKTKSKYVLQRTSCQRLPFTINNDTQLIADNYLSETVLFNDKGKMPYTFFILEKDNIDATSIPEPSDRLERLPSNSSTNEESFTDAESIF